MEEKAKEEEVGCCDEEEKALDEDNEGNEEVMNVGTEGTEREEVVEVAWE